MFVLENDDLRMDMETTGVAIVLDRSSAGLKGCMAAKVLSDSAWCIWWLGLPIEAPNG